MIRALLAIVALAGCAAEPAPAPQQSPGCLANATDEYRVRVDGAALDAHEGAAVLVTTEMRLAFAADERCTVGAATTIDGGAFTVTLQNRTDGAAYPYVDAVLDLDEDGACTPGVDLAWSVIGSVAPGGELALTVGPAEFGDATCDPRE